ncbi:hypothetical protein DHD80_04975 [Gramella sp. AN32]|nr:hypothetical protein [Gramella sp. AN32]
MKFAVGVLVGLIVIILSLLFLNNFAEKKIKKSLEDGLRKIHATYDKVDVKVLNRSAELINPSIKFKGKILEVDTIRLENIQLWEYIMNKDIVVGNLNISKPVIKFYNFEKEAGDTIEEDKSPSSDFNSRVRIKNIIVTGGSFEIFDKDSINHRLYTKIEKINLDEVRINSKTLKEQIPFDYDLILLNADSIYYDLNAWQNVYAGNFIIKNNDLLIKRFKLKPKFSKTEHQAHIQVEKDWYDLEIDSVGVKKLTWSIQNDSLQIRNDLTEITGAKFYIYRDKTQPDDNTLKPLYSRMLREASLKLGIDTLKLADVYLKYEERINTDRPPGTVDFSNLNASITNLTNIGLDREDFPKTIIHAEGKILEVATITADWEFLINDTSDNFTISGYMGGLRAEAINQFLRPALNIEASGNITNLYYNFKGNNYNANGEIKLDYKNFKVEVLRKNGKGKNKVVSAIANLIIRNKAVNEKRNYKEISVERDTSKSFWNFLWKCVKTGALKSFI